MSARVRVRWDHPSGRVARVVLARPEARNAFDGQLIAELASAFEDLARMPARELRAVVLAGDGPVFCAGADITWMRATVDSDEDANLRSAEAMAAMFERVDICPAPVLARVHGAAIGGGTGLCAVADLVIADAGTSFGFTETRLGIIPAVISPYVVAKIGESHARALFSSGVRFDALRAQRIGLVHEIVDGVDRLDIAVDTAVAELLRSGPEAARAAKAVIREIRGLSVEAARAHTTRRIAAIRVGPEAQEGLGAFLARRSPSWLDEGGLGE